MSSKTFSQTNMFQIFGFIVFSLLVLGGVSNAQEGDLKIRPISTDFDGTKGLQEDGKAAGPERLFPLDIFQGILGGVGQNAAGGPSGGSPTPKPDTDKPTEPTGSKRTTTESSIGIGPVESGSTEPTGSSSERYTTEGGSSESIDLDDCDN